MTQYPGVVKKGNVPRAVREAWSRPARGFGEEWSDGEAAGRWGMTGRSLKLGAAKPSSASTRGDRSGGLQK